MKRYIGVCAVMGIALAASNAAFATPVEIWNQTMNVAPGVWQDGTVTWLQPFNMVAYPGYTVTSATLTINAFGVNTASDTPGNEQDKVYLDLTNTGTWTYSGKMLTQSGAFSPSITNVSLGTGLTGDFGVRVIIDPSLDGPTQEPFQAQVNTSKLVVYGEAPEPPTPTVPAPGAFLLAALGAGLVSKLRCGKIL